MCRARSNQYQVSRQRDRCVVDGLPQSVDPWRVRPWRAWRVAERGPWAKAVSSLVMRSPMPENIVVPPERTTLAYRSLRMSTSHFMIDWNVVS